MKNLNLITDGIKVKKAITANKFSEWQRDVKKSLKPLAKLSCEQRKTAIHEWIALANNGMGVLKANNSTLKSKSGKTFSDENFKSMFIENELK